VHPWPRFPLSRRRALAAALGGSVAPLAALAGCTPNSANAPERRTERQGRPERDPDVALAATVLADERGLLGQVQATLDRFPGLAPLLGPARDAHQAHVDLLESAAPDDAAAASPADPSLDPSLGVPPQTPPDVPLQVPQVRHRAMLALSRAESQLALVDRRSAFAAESGAFARVLASMAASAEQHATLLRSAVAHGDGGVA
jgi:hypothetical protein